MITLGIESSCDDTSIAIVKDGTQILSSLVSSQIEIHKRFGGVVPEIASRKHLEAILPLLNEALDAAKITLNDINQIAATSGPGLLGPLLIGLTTGKALAWYLNKPLIPVNHIEAHLTASFLASEKLPEYPFIGLIVSGGHSNLVYATGPRNFETLAHTLDDAPGELYDKVARFLGLGYPGGPVIQKVGENGDPKKYQLPIPMKGKGYVFSFSGLKTAVMRVVEKEGEKLDMPSLCTSLQYAVSEALAEKVEMAFKDRKSQILAIAGGVSANKALRERMTKFAQKKGIKIMLPTLHLCTDNGAMIAAHGYLTSNLQKANTLEVNAIANWPMGE